jgi:hypothetical protein
MAEVQRFSYLNFSSRKFKNSEICCGWVGMTVGRMIAELVHIVTLQAVSHEPTILSMNLAMEVISQWRSSEKEVILRPTVKGLIPQIFGDLESLMGRNSLRLRLQWSWKESMIRN